MTARNGTGERRTTGRIALAGISLNDEVVAFDIAPFSQLLKKRAPWGNLTVFGDQFGGIGCCNHRDPILLWQRLRQRVRTVARSSRPATKSRRFTRSPRRRGRAVIAAR